MMKFLCIFAMLATAMTLATGAVVETGAKQIFFFGGAASWVGLALILAFKHEVRSR